LASRLLPTGNCWCGCNQPLDMGSFFAPGHDKRAEAKLIMELFGGVPQFLVAFGRGPADVVGTDATWVGAAMKLAGMTHGARAYMTLEYPSLNDRSGRLVRTDRPGSVKLQSAEAADAQAVFEVAIPDRGPSILFIPFLDIVGVYGGQNATVVRIAGSLDFNVLPGYPIKYVPFPTHEPTYRSFRSYQEADARYRQLGASFSRTVGPGTDGRVTLELGSVHVSLVVAEADRVEMVLPRLVAMLERGLGLS